MYVHENVERSLRLVKGKGIECCKRSAHDKGEERRRSERSEMREKEERHSETAERREKWCQQGAGGAGCSP
jgi:hypothetical protein